MKKIALISAFDIINSNVINLIFMFCQNGFLVDLVVRRDEECINSFENRLYVARNLANINQIYDNTTQLNKSDYTFIVNLEYEVTFSGASR